MIVVFTGKDALDNDKRTFDNFRRNGCPRIIEDILRKCNQRCVAFNNKANAEENSVQVNNLLDIVDHMVIQNGNGFYSAEKFTSAGQTFRRQLATWKTAFLERFRFNLTTFYTFFVMMMLLTVLSQIIVVFQYIWPPPQPEPLFVLHDIVYAKVMLNSLGRGWCLENEQYRTEYGRYEPPPPPAPPAPFILRKNTYARIILNSLGRGWCLVNELQKTEQGYYERPMRQPIEQNKTEEVEHYEPPGYKLNLKDTILNGIGNGFKKLVSGFKNLTGVFLKSMKRP